MKQVSNYYSIRALQTATCLEFGSLDEFCRFTVTHPSPDIFLLLNDSNEPQYFGIIHNHVLFRHATLGFGTLEDYSKAQVSCFPDAAVYYEALQMGYQNYDDYKLVKEAGISDKVLFEKIKNAHFISGFEDYRSMLQTEELPPAMPCFQNPYELYSYATEHGFFDYTQFRKAVSKGFTDAVLYKDACEAGFYTYDDYTDAAGKGFKTYEELKLAREKGIRDCEDMICFSNIDVVHCATCCHDQKVLLTLLSKVEQGKKISINKLKEVFHNSVEEYRYEDTGEMPAWFTVALHTDEAIIGFLHRNEQAKKFGHYDMDGEYFEVSRMQTRGVVIDGSNIAHNSQPGCTPKPLVVNIIKVIEHLKTQGFSDIAVIADASLKHKLHDLCKLPQLKQMVQYLEAPRESSADSFLIQYVKTNQCLLVSNDTFKEWKVKDRWTAENIDFYRMAFMIKGEQVLMPDL